MQIMFTVFCTWTIIYLYKEITNCNKCTFAHLRTYVLVYQYVVLYFAWAGGLEANKICLFVCLFVCLFTLVDLAVECGSSCVFRCVRVRMIMHELCTHIEAVWDRTRPCKTVYNRTWTCMIRTWTVMVVWRSFETVCALRVLDVGLGNGLVRVPTIYI